MRSKVKALGLLLSVLILVSAGLAASKVGMRQKPKVRFRVLYRFTGGSDGSHPMGGLVRDSEGNLYGTTYWGGTGYGTVFKLTKHKGSYRFSVLHTFAGKDSATPECDLLLKGDTLYGTTSVQPGGAGSGTIFSLNTDGRHFITLYRFSHSLMFNPNAGVVMDDAGILYGTTYGTVLQDAYGSVFEYSKGTRTTIINMDLFYTGAYPNRLHITKNGNLWGTTQGGGLGGDGTVFELKPSGSGGWNFSVVHSFSGSDGNAPFGRVILGKGGTVFGTTYQGDGTGCGNGRGCGVVYRLQQNNGYKESIAYDFSADNDGAHPVGQVRFNEAGHLFGTTEDGGDLSCRGGDGHPEPGCGTVFELVHARQRWQQSVLHRFEQSDGCNPSAGVVLDKQGNAFGTTEFCGIKNSCHSYGCGTLYEISGVR
jgi:uncharacterized repeat protein (TIGR03803 family)